MKCDGCPNQDWCSGEEMDANECVVKGGEKE